MRKILSERVEAFYKGEASSKKTLDVGSRKGRHSAYFPNNTSVDLFAENEPDIVADAHALPFPEASFEIVLCIEVLEHVKDPKCVIDEMRRVLMPGGTLLLTTRFLFPIHEAPEDRYRFTHYVLRELCADFSSVMITPDTRPMTALGCLIERLVWQTRFKYLNKPIKAVLMLLSRACMRLDFLVGQEYGDVEKTYEVETAFTAGYLLKAIK